jgi:hypothetical protein
MIHNIAIAVSFSTISIFRKTGRPTTNNNKHNSEHEKSWELSISPNVLFLSTLDKQLTQLLSVLSLQDTVVVSLFL